jgi:hypothetical protein
MKTRSTAITYIALIVAALLLLLIEHFTHIAFMLHLAAIPVDALIIIFIIQRILHNREVQEKRRQLMYIKSCLFRSDMRNLFILNFTALKSPNLTIEQVKNASWDELKNMRQQANKVEYKSAEAMEPVILEYVNARYVWQNFMDLAITHDFQDIFEDMVYLLHFVQDVTSFKNAHPDKLFIYEALKDEQLMTKVYKVLGDGIRKFLEYAMELKEKRPDMFNQIISDYCLTPEMGS